MMKLIEQILLQLIFYNFYSKIKNHTYKLRDIDDDFKIKLN